MPWEKQNHLKQLAFEKFVIQIIIENVSESGLKLKRDITKTSMQCVQLAVNAG